MSFALIERRSSYWLGGCPNDIACMKKLDDEIVFDAVKSLLAHSKKRESKESLPVVDWKSASY